MLLQKLSNTAYTHRKLLAAVFAIYCALLVFGILFGAFFSPSAYDNSYMSTIHIDDGWRVLEDGKETSASAALPYSLKNKKCTVVDLYRTLPETDFHSGVLITTAYQKGLEVSIADKQLFSYRPEKADSRTFTPGSGRFFVTLPNGFAGKELHLRYDRTVPSDNSSISRVSLYSNLQNPFVFIPGSELLFVFMLALFMIGLVLFAVAIVSNGRRLLGSPLFSLAIFAISSSVWVTCNTNLAQFFTQNLILLHNIEYISFYVMPVALWMFTWLIWNHSPKITLPAIAVTSAFFALALTLKFFGILDFYRLLTLFHILILFCFAGFIILLKSNYRTGDFPLHMFFCGLGTLAFACVLEIIRYYFFSANDMVFSFFIMGIICLVLCTITSYLYTFKQRMQFQIENRMYKELAYTDKLTGLCNRLTFEEDIAALEQEQDKYRNIVFVNLDINHFKRVNDTYGHVTGDEVLKMVAQELSAVCNDPNRRCYRLGGDEFCIVAANNTVRSLNEKLMQMNARLEGTFTQFPVSVSFGIAEYNKFLHASLMDVFKASDELMYQSKQGQHRRASDRRRTT